mmetsp:Transcript_48241/g.134655  ORF Transcript_48241/g.134655 Transcript_48241/m.134655 type:complete len:223 (-) Transcript_48241:37-705(-)
MAAAKVVLHERPGHLALWSPRAAPMPREPRTPTVRQRPPGAHGRRESTASTGSAPSCGVPAIWPDRKDGDRVGFRSGHLKRLEGRNLVLHRCAGSAKKPPLPRSASSSEGLHGLAYCDGHPCTVDCPLPQTLGGRSMGANLHPELRGVAGEQGLAELAVAEKPRKRAGDTPLVRFGSRPCLGGNDRLHNFGWPRSLERDGESTLVPAILAHGRRQPTTTGRS